MPRCYLITTLFRQDRRANLHFILLSLSPFYRFPSMRGGHHFMHLQYTPYHSNLPLQRKLGSNRRLFQCLATGTWSSSAALTSPPSGKAVRSIPVCALETLANKVERFKSRPSRNIPDHRSKGNIGFRYHRADASNGVPGVPHADLPNELNIA